MRARLTIDANFLEMLRICVFSSRRRALRRSDLEADRALLSFGIEVGGAARSLATVRQLVVGACGETRLFISGLEGEIGCARKMVSFDNCVSNDFTRGAGS